MKHSIPQRDCLSEEELHLAGELQRLKPELNADEKLVLDYMLAEGMTLIEMRKVLELVCGLIIAKTIN